jgi:hypothetical protein
MARPARSAPVKGRPATDPTGPLTKNENVRVVQAGGIRSSHMLIEAENIPATVATPAKVPSGLSTSPSGR